MANTKQNTPGKKFSLRVGIALLVLVSIGAVAFNAIWRVNRNDGYEPIQPIPFSHKLHAGQRQISCQYCHVGVDKGKVAMVPAVATCMNCHTVVKTDSPHIQKLTKYWKEGKEVPWIKVHDLPDHVNFNHSAHVLKQVSCETCHGKVEEMEIIQQKETLGMGFCLNCHRGVTAPPHIPRAPSDTPPNSRIEAGHVAPQSCWTCHH